MYVPYCEPLAWEQVRAVASLDLETTKKALIDNGFEIYRSNTEEIHLAERVRYHIMDSGVSVSLNTGSVFLTCRSQRSDFPGDSEEQLFNRVRQHLGGSLTTRGYVEESSRKVEVRNPSDESTLLDVWFEVSYRKPLEELDEMVSELRWAIACDKYVPR